MFSHNYRQVIAVAENIKAKDQNLIFKICRLYLNVTLAAGLLEKESKWRSESDLKPESPSLVTARSSPGAASSSSSHCDLGLIEAGLAGSEPRS